MSDKQNTVNGWSNYQTWAVYTWLINEEQTNNYWKEQTETCRAKALHCPEVLTGEWSIDEANRIVLADQLQEEFEQASPLTEPTIYADLLDVAIEEVNWREIAKELLTEDREEPPARPARNAAFSPGRFLVAARAFETLPPEEIAKGLSRHLAADWGDVCEQDRQENELSLKEGFRLLSVYHTADRTKFWIITEADRSATTVLLPDEY